MKLLSAEKDIFNAEAHYGTPRPLHRFWSEISIRQFENYNIFLQFLKKFVICKKTFSMNFFRCVNNFNDTFKGYELALQSLKNIREFLKVDRMCNCVMVVDHPKVCRVTLIESILCDRKNWYVLRGFMDIKNIFKHLKTP